MAGSEHKIAASRRAEIVSAARQSFMKNGIANTNVKTITDEAGVTRTLFYHYFKDKDDVIDAVVDDSCNNMIDSLREWFGNLPEDISKRDAIAGSIKVLRDHLSLMINYRRISIDNDDATLYLNFTDRLVHRVTDFLTEEVLAPYVQEHSLTIEHVHETISMMGIGFVGFMRINPETPDDVLTDIVIQTLHLD